MIGRRKQRRMKEIGPFDSQVVARRTLGEPNQVAVVERGIPRTLLMPCPDGCGEMLTINLDPRVGKAWRLYRRDGRLSLFPSVWRDTGCESHFVFWDNIVFWFDKLDTEEPSLGTQQLQEDALGTLSDRDFMSFVEVADRLNDIPWKIERILRRHVAVGKAEEREGKERGFFRRLSGNSNRDKRA
jgi:hypothetical protein